MLGFAALALSALLTMAVDPVEDGQSQQSESAWQDYFVRHASDYAIVPTVDSRGRFKLREKPVLRWSQPVRGGDDGAVYLWLDEGRPAVIGTIFAWPESQGFYIVQHELHSLSLEPITAKWRGGTVWAPERAGIEFKPVPGASKPADSTAQRSRQLRAIARNFTAASTDDEGGEWQLRLLNQHLYRYKTDKSGQVLDGGLFAFVQGTDPEVLLLIEARRDGDDYHWQYACARFSDFRLHVSHRDAVVWKVPRANPMKSDPHYYFPAERRRPPEPTDSDRETE